MKQLFFFVAIFLTSSLLAQETTFKPGQEVYAFGDRTKLRSGADVSSEVLTLLPIGEAVEILEEMDALYAYNGYDWHWYKVRHQGKTGYIVGGLLSKERLEHAGQVFLVNYKRSEGHMSLLMRAVKIGGGYSEVELKGDYYSGQTRNYELSDGMGLAGVENILYVHRSGESCGDGGGYQVIFFDGMSLYAVMRVSNFADIGGYDETHLVYPHKHEKGANAVLMQISSHTYEVTDDFEEVEDGEETSCTTTRVLRWNGKELLGKKE